MNGTKICADTCVEVSQNERIDLPMYFLLALSCQPFASNLPYSQIEPPIWSILRLVLSLVIHHLLDGKVKEKLTCTYIL
jgi:hypothetical protein